MSLGADTQRKRDREIAATTKGEATAENILDAAFKSIAVHGCGAVTLRGIADEAGVVLSQLNYHYGNKNRLFAAVLKRMQHGYIEALDVRLHGHDSLEGQIAAVVDYNESVLIDSPETYRNFLEFFNFAMNSKPFQVEVDNFTSQIAAMIEKRIVQYQCKDEAMACFSAAALTRFILSASFGIALQRFLSPENEDARAGFSIIKATASQLIRQNRDAMPLD
ncbi:MULTISPECIES: TetR/AcrR family transcriptional regulator [Alphaproteobacteria]|uniref:TetR/AcrR family transcriptional regulator n=1 Tax=Alphaproteobacteria TaxID=28211 RepID=UPI000A1F88B4|nr:TetR/AcrR family transcriptional regulator [Thalassospira alkalitolerans]|tara:strand:+ start:415101 stop:415763 length:663 start_codon:yes stop_codon:yes gene_type:complete